jgi:PAS domain S-box-containing protein
MGDDSNLDLSTTDPAWVRPRLRAQYEIVRALAASSSLTEAAPKILHSIGDSLGWDVGGLWVVAEESNVLRCVDMWQSEAAAADEFVQMSLERPMAKGEGLPGRVWASGKPAWIVDVVSDMNFPRAPAARAVGLHAGFAFPIVYMGRVLAVAEFFGHEALLPDTDVLEMMGAVGIQVGQFVEQKRTEEEIRKSEARKASILESAMDCVIVMDHRGRIVEFNPAAEVAFGYSRDQVVGELLEIIIPERLRERHRRGLQQYLETGRGPIIGNRIELAGLRADGTEFPIELAVTAVPLDGPPLFTAYLRDITERRTAERDREHLLGLEREARSVAERMQERLAFLADAGTKIGASLSYAGAIQALADVSVPFLGDWCIVDLLDEAEAIHRAALAHVPGVDAELVAQMTRPSSDPTFEQGVRDVLATGRSALVTNVTEEIVAELAVTPDRDQTLRRLAPRSYMIVPFGSWDTRSGAVVFVSSSSERRYSGDDLSLAEDLVSRASIAIDKARLYQERTNVARALQKALLPPSLPHIPGIEVAASYEPAGEGAEVGGDFYDVFSLGRRRWAVVIGDVSGKGAEAAALTGLARHTLRAAAMQLRDPIAILKVLNEAILQQTQEDRYCSVAFATMEKTRDGAKLAVVCAGHPAPLVLRSDGVIEAVGEADEPLGLFPEIEPSSTAVTLSVGDALVFYTDGVTEARREGRVFGAAGLRKVLTRARGESAASLAKGIREAVTEFEGGRPRDDLAVLALRLAPTRAGKSQTLDFEIPGGFTAAAFARRSLDSLDGQLPTVIADEVRLLVNELVTNSVRHARIGSDQHIGLRVVMSSRRVRVEVRDQGPGFKRPAGGPTLDRDSGWGLHLVDRLADRWGVETDGETCVWFEIDR